MNNICCIYDDSTKRYGLTFVTCKKHYNIKLMSVIFGSNGHIKTTGQTLEKCHECINKEGKKTMSESMEEIKNGGET